MTAKESIYNTLNKNAFMSALFEARRIKRHREHVERVRSSSYNFIDRSKGSDKLCIILAGYKEALWDDVFSRIDLAAPADLDICIMTSGLENEQLKRIAVDRNWSYLSTEVNHLSFNSKLGY